MWPRLMCGLRAPFHLMRCRLALRGGGRRAGCLGGLKVSPRILRLRIPWIPRILLPRILQILGSVKLRVQLRLLAKMRSISYRIYYRFFRALVCKRCLFLHTKEVSTPLSAKRLEGPCATPYPNVIREARLRKIMHICVYRAACVFAYKRGVTSFCVF
nr:hypothetical protein [Crucivirus sp.]